MRSINPIISIHPPNIANAMKTKSRSFRQFALAPLAALCLSAGLSTAAAQSSIGVNYGTIGFNTLAPTDSAGAAPFAQTHYNNVSVAPTSLVLNDNTGAASTVALTTTGADSFSVITTPVAGPDETLNNTRANSSATSWSFSLTGITYASYSIVVYDLQFGAGAELGIDVGGLNYYTSSPDYTAAGYLDDNAATPYTYTQGTSTNSAAPTALGDYVVFTNLSGSSQTVTLTGFGGGERIGGFQIVQTVPEPSTWAMLGLGVAGLGFTLRRRATRV